MSDHNGNPVLKIRILQPEHLLEARHRDPQAGLVTCGLADNLEPLWKFGNSIPDRKYPAVAGSRQADRQ